MAATIFHSLYAVTKKWLPGFIHRPVRSVATALFTPIRFSVRKGHFRSSLAVKAVDRDGTPIPWYTYPCIDFLKCREFEGFRVLEFGAGQSTLWWAKNAASVVSFEGDRAWYGYLKARVPANVSLHFAREDNAQVCVEDVENALSETPALKFDIVIIDGLWRFELIEIAKKHLKENGAVICDNSEGYGFYEGFLADKTFQKVDFYGYTPGCMLQSCTTVYFKNDCPLFDTRVLVRNIEKYK
jgi:hypothetical protein